MTNYPPRLIEVDLPIKRISAHARREKSIRHGHISTLHIWWARRPLAACRAVICAALWPDPASEDCPQPFRDRATDLITEFAVKAATTSFGENCSTESRKTWIKLAKPEGRIKSNDPAHLIVLRNALFDFIADFANWDNSTVPEYLDTARALTQAAHEALGGEPGTRPLVVDPFAGGGAIPLEALRVGADAFASDLNPVAVLLNKVVLEYIPKYGQRLADEVRKWGEWIKEQAEKELAEFYPKDPDGATPIAYLWARTITCEGPGCGAEVPLMRSLWLAKKGSNSIALRLVSRPRAKRVDFEIIENAKAKDVGEGTVKRGSATCPVCGYTTAVARVRAQMRERRGGAADARLYCVVTTKFTEQGRFCRLPTERDFQTVSKAVEELERRRLAHIGPLPLIPDEPLPAQGTLGFRVQLYGMREWGDLFTPRQALALVTLVSLLQKANDRFRTEQEPEIAIAVLTCLALAVDRVADRSSSLCRYDPSPKMSGINNTFSRQAVSMIWDFGEGDVKSERSGGWDQSLEWVVYVLEHEAGSAIRNGIASAASAISHPLPNDSAQCFFTDPPYYDAVPYADLSDFFIVWLKRTIGELHSELLGSLLSPKDEECIVDEVNGKDKTHFEVTMRQAMAEGRRVLAYNGVGAVVFANKSTAGWESQLQAMLDAGWIITGSWPIDTEMGNRLRAMDSAALASSIHLICRPRENPDGSIRADDVGDWRDVLAALPKRIHEWMPRLAQEGVVGADAIFACLGPALEIFSRYSRVEKASGEVVTLREYLEQVWGAVAKEALNMIFTGADASGLEEDARLTAMWLWTLTTKDGGEASTDEESDEAADEDEEGGASSKATGGYVLEYDAARKIAQGLGAHLETLTSMVEVKGDKARLLPVSDRTRYLFGKDEAQAPTKRAKKAAQMSLFQALDEAAEEDSGWGEKTTPKAGQTALDRVHQSMILFAAGRSDALKRFLVEDGIGKDQRFWSLAQALSALYPATSDEKRWVDGVLARKKGLGF